MESFVDWQSNTRVENKLYVYHIGFYFIVLMKLENNDIDILIEYNIDGFLAEKEEEDNNKIIFINDRTNVSRNFDLHGSELFNDFTEQENIKLFKLLDNVKRIRISSLQIITVIHKFIKANHLLIINENQLDPINDDVTLLNNVTNNQIYFYVYDRMMIDRLSGYNVNIIFVSSSLDDHMNTKFIKYTNIGDKVLTVKDEYGDQSKVEYLELYTNAKKITIRNFKRLTNVLIISKHNDVKVKVKNSPNTVRLCFGNDCYYS